jgi:hypothetical protein
MALALYNANLKKRLGIQCRRRKKSCFSSSSAVQLQALRLRLSAGLPFDKVDIGDQLGFLYHKFISIVKFDKAGGSLGVMQNRIVARTELGRAC